MREAYAGGGEEFYDPYYEQHVQDVANQMMQEPEYQTASMRELPAEDVAESIIYQIGDTVGWWTLLGLIVVGGFYVVRKRLKRALRRFLVEDEDAKRR